MLRWLTSLLTSQPYNFALLVNVSKSPREQICVQSVNKGCAEETLRAAERTLTRGEWFEHEHWKLTTDLSRRRGF